MMDKEFIISAFRNVRRRLMTRHNDDDEDSLQEAFCRLWTRRDDFTSQGEAEGFLTVAARNFTVDRQRRKQVHPETDLKYIDRDPSTEDEDDRSGLYSEVSRLIEGYLSERDREILIRRDHDGWDFDEIADHYGISEANARMIVSRSRKTIRELYIKRKNR